MHRKNHVVLTAEQRQELEQLVRTGTRSAQVIRRAQILLKADEGSGGPGWTNAAITAAFGAARSTLGRIRRRFVQEGLTAALERRPSSGRKACKLDGDQQARLTLLACGPAPRGHPEGRSRWSLRLLAEQVVLLGMVDGISPETVRQALKRGS